MRGSSKFLWFLLGGVGTVLSFIAVGFVISVFMGSIRPPSPPDGELMPYPFGAIDLDELDSEYDSELENSIARSLEMDKDRGKDEGRTYNLLALSGGGSNGAFGAGLLCGWTAAGNRPDFKVVTGVSTGALQATAAFLGSEYDYILKEIYTEYGTRDIYRRRFPLLLFAVDGIYHTEPLKKLIARYITSDLLQAVADKHNAGRRLFVGTTNLDSQEFVIWNMGLIAASGREDAIELYRKVLLASASVPVVFEPIYFEVEKDGEKFYEMHCDGGAYSQVFFRGFLLDFEEALTEIGLFGEKTKIELYIINNGKPLVSRERTNVSPRAASIAAVTINNLFNITITSSLFRMYVITSRYGVGFNLATLGDESELFLEPLDFDKEKMRKLFDYSYEATKAGYKWISVPPGLDPGEAYEVVDHNESKNNEKDN